MRRPIYLYVTPFFPSRESWRGGYCYDAVCALKRTGRYDVRVLVGESGVDYEYNGVQVSRFRRLAAPCGLFPFLFARINSQLFLRKIEELGISLQDVAVCHVNTSGYINYGAAVKKKAPAVKVLLHHHCSAPIGLRSGRLGIVPFHATILYFYFMRHCAIYDVHVFVSKKSRDTFGLFFRKAPEECWIDIRSSLLFGKFLPPLRRKVSLVLYNGIDKSMFNTKGRHKHKEFVIGNVANFQPLKDQITLINAFAMFLEKVPSAKLRLIGTGECLSACKKLASEKCPPESVSFEKEVDHLALPDFYRSLDLFAFPSRFEGFACVCVEALACGTPFITCRTISSSEILAEEGREQWLIDPMDARDLADKMYAQFASPSQMKLNCDMSIDSLISTFLDRIDQIQT